MLEEVIVAVSSKKLSLPEEPVEEESWKFQVGKYVLIDRNVEVDEDTASGISLFWIGFGWKITSTNLVFGLSSMQKQARQKYGTR
jgi:hypothetical protein